MTLCIFFFDVLTLFCIISCSKIGTNVKMDISDTDNTVSYINTKAAINYNVSIDAVSDYISRNSSNKRSINSIQPLIRNESIIGYIVNYDKGWEIYSADKRIRPILACSETGHFDVNAIPKTGISIWMNGITEMTNEIRNGDSPSNINTALWEDLPLNEFTQEVATTKVIDSSAINNRNSEVYTWTKYVVTEQTEYQYHYLTYQPLIETEWAQGYPWNESIYINDTTRVAGCVAVALGQLLYYYHNKIGVPSGLYHTVTLSDWSFYNGTSTEDPYYMTSLSRGDYTENSSRWNNMPIYAYQPGKNSQYVSELLLDIGNRVDMHYHCDTLGSSANIDNARNTLYSFNLYSVKSYGGPQNGGLNDIIAERPYYIQGNDITLHQGHAWVIDGATLSRYKTTTTYSWVLGYSPNSPNVGGIPATQEEANAAAEAGGYDKPESGMISVEVTYSPSMADFHSNWGLNSNMNGYFANIGNYGSFSFSANIMTLSNIVSNGTY